VFYDSQHQYTSLDSEQFLSTILTHDKTWQTTSLFLERFTMGWRVKFYPTNQNEGCGQVTASTCARQGAAPPEEIN
jgi:hypothetical protein